MPPTERNPKPGPEPDEDTPQQPFPGVERKMDPEPDHGEESYRGCGKLQGLVAIVTGGDSGIGRAVAIAFAREGADVAVGYESDREDHDANETRRWVEKAGRRCLLEKLDVRDFEQCRRFVERVAGELERVDVLVNNAAYQQSQTSIEDISEEQFVRTVMTNLGGYFHMAKAVLPHLKAGSAIVNTGSVTGLRGNKTLIDYASTKGAIHMFTKSLAESVAEKGIRVNCVAPGPVWTPFIPASMPPEAVASFGRDTYWKRPAQPAELAPAYVFLASADSRYCTGEILAITGEQSTR